MNSNFLEHTDRFFWDIKGPVSFSGVMEPSVYWLCLFRVCDCFINDVLFYLMLSDFDQMLSYLATCLTGVGGLILLRKTSRVHIAAIGINIIIFICIPVFVFMRGLDEMQWWLAAPLALWHQNRMVSGNISGDPCHRDCPFYSGRTAGNTGFG